MGIRDKLLLDFVAKHKSGTGTIVALWFQAKNEKTLIKNRLFACDIAWTGSVVGCFIGGYFQPHLKNNQRVYASILAVFSWVAMIVVSEIKQYFVIKSKQNEDLLDRVNGIINSDNSRADRSTQLQIDNIEQLAALRFPQWVFTRQLTQPGNYDDDETFFGY